MKATIKPIDTEYKGYLFRSRLEARWAIYFDALGVKWQYEAEGYEFKNGDRYLPDFYFPEYRFYGEVKPVYFEGERVHQNLVLESGLGIVFFTNTPGEHIDFAIYSHPGHGLMKHQGLAFAQEITGSVGAAMVTPYFARAGCNEDFYPALKYARKCAKQARFEHGNKIEIRNFWYAQTEIYREEIQYEFAKTGNIQAYKSLTDTFEPES